MEAVAEAEAEAEEVAVVEEEVVPGEGEVAVVMAAVGTVEEVDMAAAADMEEVGTAAAAVGVTTVGKVGILLGSVARAAAAAAAGGMEAEAEAAPAAGEIVIAVVNQVTLQGTVLIRAIDLVF